jgi:hypothetical protein
VGSGADPTRDYLLTPVNFGSGFFRPTTTPHALPGPLFVSYGQTVAGDADGDGVPDAQDNCPSLPNPDQAISFPALFGPGTGHGPNGLGDRCNPDIDGDGIPNAADHCPRYPDASNPVTVPGVTCFVDTDGDGVDDSHDNCPTVPNPDQKDSNGNGIGDACELCASYSGSVAGWTAAELTPIPQPNVTYQLPLHWEMR